MNEHYENHRAVLDTVRRFEQMQARQESVFFDLEDFELIIDHYVTNARFEEALQACEAALGQYPFSTELLIDRAQVTAMRGDYTEAERQIDHVATLDPTNADVAVTRGIISTQRGQFAEAVAFFQIGLEQEPERDDIHFNLGLAYQSWQKFKSAAKHYKQSLRLNPDNETGVQELLHCLEISGRLEEHAEFFQKFTDDDPYAAMAWYNLGQYWYRREDFTKAAEAFDYAIVISPDFYDAHHWLADAFVCQEEFRKAIAEFELSYAPGEPTDEALCNIGECYEKLREWDAARRFYRQALEVNPEMDEAWFGQGVLMQEQERWMEAIHFFRKATELYGDSGEYWAALGAAENQVGNVVSALEAYEKATEVAPEEAQGWVNWSAILYEQGHFGEAAALVQHAVELHPHEAHFHYMRCAYLLADGHLREAYQSLETALALNYDQHTLLFDYFPELRRQPALLRLIDQHRS
ncbi:tetratricopeptide repeat protein [Hymenobacter sp. PAMC 26628]|uniref:tetratricopeptide repeat protein n=1 Tax=Hymenobacter sp. PAMC 26628 TaxID=1484118 RepID=UPI0007705E0B|nr:tetratricopeptide repeat protein [Hymenobacter sp. PAMC 26628]AMJ67140.1 hypothetical protein AXW84_18175 [Hymenobacter sp. PAMC 26628]